MKKLLIIFIFFSLSCQAQFNTPLINARQLAGETPAQNVTRQYCILNGITGADEMAFKRFTASLEDAGLYYKLMKFTVYKYYGSGKAYNMICPLDYTGAFTDSVRHGTPALVSSGITLHNLDTLNTFWVNNFASDAPFTGAFWITSTAVDAQIFTSASPFNIEPNFGGKAYVSIWASSPGVTVPATPAGFCLGQRWNTDTTQFYQGTTKYNTASSINSASPMDNYVFIKGNSTADFTIKVSGICFALTESEVINLKAIIEKLLSDLGI